MGKRQRRVLGSGLAFPHPKPSYFSASTLTPRLWPSLRTHLVHVEGMQAHLGGCVFRQHQALQLSFPHAAPGAGGPGIHPVPPSADRQQPSTSLRPTEAAGGLLPRPPVAARLYSPGACHGAGSSARGDLTGVQRGEGTQGRGDLGPVPGALQVSGQWGAPAGGASYHVCNKAQWLSKKRGG